MNENKSVAIINLSSRLNGNCSIIAKYIKEVKENCKIFEFGNMNFSNCGKCDYECFKMTKCPLQDDLSTLFNELVNYQEIVFIVPNYCGYPCANYFSFNERRCEMFSINRAMLAAYLSIPKRFVIVSNSDISLMKNALIYQNNENMEFNYLQVKSRDYGSQSIGIWADNEKLKEEVVSYFSK